MRLEKISRYEIKAYLSADDIKELGIRDAARLDRGAADVILGIAGAELDFGCEKSNCEIYAEADGDGYILTIKAPCAAADGKALHECVLCFDDGSALKAACVFLSGADIPYSELRAEGGSYYLIVKYGQNGTELDGRPYRLCSVSELCSSVHTDKNAFFYYISEHSYTLIEKNAVYDIAKNEKKW